MATKDADGKKGGLLGWLRGGKQAGAVPAAGGASAPPLPVLARTTSSLLLGEMPSPGQLLQDVSLRHVDRGEIAQGGMGSIRKVFDTNLQRIVAMKVLFPEHRNDARSMQRFADEAQILGQLEHPNIVPVHDFGEDDEGTRYFTMTLVRGKTLTQILEDEKASIGSRELYFKMLHIFRKTCDAVAFAHSRGVVHRDLKPDNIMVGKFGEVFLMDWGIAKLLDRPGHENDEETVRVKRELPAEDESGKVIGTFHYISPEQAFGKVDLVNESTDIFLLGGVLYEVLTGRPPYVADTAVELIHMAQRHKLKAPEEVAKDRDIPAALSRICMRCLAKEPGDRYANVDELIVDVESFLRGGASFPQRTYKGGEHLMVQGETGNEVFVVNKGAVQVYKIFEDGKRQGIATLGPGSVVGEAAVLSAGVRTASVVAIEDVVVTIVTRLQLEQELGINGWMGTLVKTLADRFVGLDERYKKSAQDLTASQVEAFVLSLLLKHGKPGVDGRIEVRMTPVLSKSMQAFKRPEAEIRAHVEKSLRLEFVADRDAVVFVGDAIVPKNSVAKEKT